MKTLETHVNVQRAEILIGMRVSSTHSQPMRYLPDPGQRLYSEMLVNSRTDSLAL